MERRAAVFILIPLFFLSGISALLYQVVWLKYLGLVFGNTVHAAATLIALFLAGLGIGAAIFARAFRARPPLLVYAVVEACIGAYASFSPNAFALLDDAYVATYQAFIDAPVALTLARIACAAVFLLPPTILMGGTLPLLVRAYGGEHDERGQSVSKLYAANTFGATAGVALAGFLTIPAIGLIATIFVGVVINFVLAAISALLAFASAKRQAELAPERPSAARARAATFIVAASFVMGMTSIADEVFWSRILVLHLGSSVYAYSLMLFAFLVGLALGSAVVDRVIGRVSSAALLGWLQLALGIVLVLQIHYFAHFADVLEQAARLWGLGSYASTLAALLTATLSAILVPTAIMGATFPLAVQLHRERTGGTSSDSVGSIYLFNTLGSIVGSLLAGFVLIRLVGSQNGLLTMALLNIALGALFLTAAKGRAAALRLAFPTLGVAVLIAALAKPDQVILSAGLFVDEKGEILLFREDVTATVTLRKFGPKFLSLELNGVNVAGTSPDLIGTQKLQGHLPLLMHPNARSVLHIGFGSGGTAHAVSTHPVDNITIAEISPEVLETSDRRLREVNHGVLEDPRVRAQINDGRNYVLAAPEKFDVILSDSIHPRYAGNGSLYTQDYFELCKERLNRDGIVSMWLPIYSLTPRNYLMILRAFRNVFPNTTVWYVPNSPNAYTIVIGRMEEGPLSIARMQQKMTPRIASELAGIGIRDPYDLATALLLDREGVATLTHGVEPHVDDRPAVEYESGRVVHRDYTWYQNFVMLTNAATPLARAFEPAADRQRLRFAESVRLDRARSHIALLRRALKM